MKSSIMLPIRCAVVMMPPMNSVVASATRLSMSSSPRKATCRETWRDSSSSPGVIHALAHLLADERAEVEDRVACGRLVLGRGPARSEPLVATPRHGPIEVLHSIETEQREDHRRGQAVGEFAHELALATVDESVDELVGDLRDHGLLAS